MKLKSMFAVFATVSLSLGALTGCGTSKETANTAKEKKDDLPWDAQAKGYKMEKDVLNGKEPLKVWLDNDDYANAIIEAFNAKYPKVKIEYEKVGAVDTRAKMELDGEAGLGADVFVQPHDGIGASLESAIIGPMGKYTDQIKDRFLDASVGTVMKDGQAYGVPISTESVALFYNKTLLKQLTGSDTAPTEWDQITELANTYNDKKKNQWTIRWEAGNSYTSYFFLSSYGYDLFGKDGKDASKIGFDTPEAKAALEAIKAARSIWDVNSADATNDTTTLEFAKGKTPFLITGPWAIADVQKGADKNKFEFGIAKLPKINGNQPITFSGNQIANVSSYSKHPAAARIFAMFLGSKEGAEVLYKTTGKLPALKEQYASQVAGLGNDELLKGVAAQAEFSKPMPSIPEMANWWDPAKNMIVNVWDGLMSPEDAQKKAVEDYEALQAGKK
ncbi:maltose ABC transporter substrate-binding protein [Gottfriedia acidiceleris]|uniref:sugar ABC transporter substrate-binding protein n=1 Tax=Gottfriedia acidiceleris TaxID=371036 RepID=UPI000B4409D0|nr:maltose ABC transporter substrate-binding protein [Gottfriedia acidiceleris]